MGKKQKKMWKKWGKQYIIRLKEKKMKENKPKNKEFYVKEIKENAEMQLTIQKSIIIIKILEIINNKFKI